MTVAGITVTGAADASHRLQVAGQEAGMLAGRVDSGVSVVSLPMSLQVEKGQVETGLRVGLGAGAATRSRPGQVAGPPTGRRLQSCPADRGSLTCALRLQQLLTT